jgi:hypothetical protein
MSTSDGADVRRSVVMESQELSVRDSSIPCVGQIGGDAVVGVRDRLELVDWVRTYPTFRFGGVEGTRVCTVAFRKTDSV